MTFKVFLSLILAFMLAGCGQSGPLYVPGDPSSIKTPSQIDDGENSEDEEDDEDG